MHRLPAELLKRQAWVKATGARVVILFEGRDAAGKSDCRKRARLNAMRCVLHRMPCAGRDMATTGPVDPLIIGRPTRVPVLRRSAAPEQGANSPSPPKA